MSVPCSSGLKPSWLVYALERGFDGVFIATDGEECALLPDCAERTAQIAAQAQKLMEAKGMAAQRLKMAALCSVCAEPFVKYMREFTDTLLELGPAQLAAV